ncbi:MAG: hypothetical protein KTR33_16530, partial [Gammaproteobacteria bacterium]|nr:hypothetical protein [Gammaproteobacteria bacterium]
MSSADRSDKDIDSIRQKFERVDTASPASDQQYREISAGARQRSLSLHDNRLARIDALRDLL